MLRPAQRQQPPVDCRKAQRDKPHAGEMPGLQLLAEKQEAQQHRADRDQKSDQQQVGRPRRGQDAEENQIGQRR